MRLFRSSFLLVVLVLFLTNILFAQAYDEPESVVYDATNDRYLVSNKGDGDIISVPRLDPDGLTYFAQSFASSIRGIAIKDGSLYAAGTDNDGITEHIYTLDLNTGNETNKLTVDQASFLNDIAIDEDGMLYFSDNNNIYIAPTEDTYTVLLADAGANGLLVDNDNNRLLYTDDTPTTGSAISAIDLTTKTSATLINNPNFQWLDGLTVDHQGNYYVSCWSQPNAVYRYDPNFTSSVLASDGHNGVDHSGAADIFYDQVNNILAVPNFTANTVDFIPFAQLSAIGEITSIPSKFQLHQNFPNPFNPTTTIFYDVSKESNVKVTVFDLLGREIIKLIDQIEPIGTRSINWDGRDYIGNLVKAGVYIYRIEAERFIQTKKMVLLK